MPNPKPPSPYKGTQAISRAISLITLFSDEHPQWTLPELIETLNLNRTTVYRLLSVLEEAEWIVRNPQTESYRLGSEMIVLGGRAQRANKLRTITLPHLRELAQSTGETASLEILSGRDALLIEEVVGHHVMSGAQEIGSRWPAHATSTGKAILAHLPTADLEAFLTHPLAGYTKHTLTSAAALRTHLTKIRTRGYATAIEELELGYTSLGAPIFNHQNQAIAAVSIGGTTGRFKENATTYTTQLRQTADQISYQMGHRM